MYQTKISRDSFFDIDQQCRPRSDAAYCSLIGSPQFAWRNFNMYLTHQYKPSHFLTYANSVDQDQTPQRAASDQGLHRLLTVISICT